MNYDDMLDEILNNRKAGPNDALKMLARVATGEKVCITVTVEPDGRQEYSISPWEPYQPRCPYADLPCGEEDDEA